MNYTPHTLALGLPETNAYGDAYFKEINASIFRNRSAEASYEKRFGKEGFQEDCLYIICGTDSGLLPKYIISKGRTEGAKFIFLEHEQAIEQVTKNIGSNVDEKYMRIESVDSFLSNSANLHIDRFYYRNALFLIPSFSVLGTPHPAYADLAWRSQQAIDRLALNYGVKLNNRFFLLTVLNNLAENRLPARSLGGVFSGRSAIILGAGPSLDDLVPWVARHRDRFDVLAVSRTSRRLLDAGIKPDLVFSIDPQTISFDVGREMLRFGPETVFVNNTHACPQLVGQWPGRSLYHGSRLPWEASRDPSPGNTVTHLAVWTAIQFGYKRIVLGGVDLCHSRAGHTHAKGSAERDAGPNLVRGAVEVTTNAGDTALTDLQLSQGIGEMAQLAEFAHSQGTAIINPAPGAAHIPGVEYRDLDQITTEEPPEPFLEVVGRALPPEGPDERCRYYAETLEEIELTRRNLRRIQGWSKAALRHIGRAFEEGVSPAAFQKHNRKIDAAEDRIRSQFPGLRNCLIQLQAGQFTQALRPDRNTWEKDEIQEVSRLVFDSYLRSAQDLIDHLDTALRRLETRKTEETPHPTDTRRLFQQWREDRQPGRIHICRGRNPVLKRLFDGSLREQARELEDAFAQAMTRQRTFSGGFDPETIRGRAALLANRRDAEGLQRLLEGLREHQGETATDLGHLAAGYAAELEGDILGATEHFRKVGRAHVPKAREDSLRRLAAIKLQAGAAEEGVQILQELTELNPDYRPEYANILRLSGRLEEAINQYNEHLARQPEDSGTMLKLGELYLSIGAVGPARMAFQYVKSISPDDPDATNYLVSLKKSAPESR